MVVQYMQVCGTRRSTLLLSVYTHTLLTRDAGLPARQSFLRGNISTRRTHISR
jgi:hypothetical protein